MIKIENKIKEARQNAGLTQKAMSELFGIPQKTIEAWEGGRRSPVAWAEKLIIDKLKSISRQK